MDFTDLRPDAEAQRILSHILVDFAADDPAQPWADGELRVSVREDAFPVPDLALAALVWVGFVDQRWDEKTAWRLGGRFRNTNVSFASTKFGLRVMVESGPEVSEQLEMNAEAQPAQPRFNLPDGVVTSVQVDSSAVSDLDQLVNDFVAALRKAVRVFEKHVLADVVKEQVAAGNITLLNQSSRLRGAYTLFRWQAQALIDGHGDPELRKEMIAVCELAAGGATGQGNFFLPFFVPVNVGYCLNAMASAYFSWLEHVLVLALPFTAWEPTDHAITEIIGYTWADKWRYVVSDGPETKLTFDKLTVAAEQFRNLDAHGGFGKKEQSLLVHTPMGAVPARLIEGANVIRATVISEAASTFPEACAIFDIVDEFLRTGPLRDAMVWIEGGLQVPFDAGHRKTLREAMALGGAAFVEEVDRFAILEDGLHNFEG